MTRRASEIVEGDLVHIQSALKVEQEVLAGKDVLITGGAGFLGYYLVQTALAWNAQGGRAPIRLSIYDSYARGVPGWLGRLEGDPNVSVVRHDMATPLPAAMGDFHYILHASSIAAPQYYRARPIETMDANVNGLRNLLEYCLRQKERGRPVEGLLFYSSSEIYGDPTPDHIPTAESYRGNVSCTGPRACYDEAKRYGETLCVNFAQRHGLPIKVVRPFNNYGPGLKISDTRVIPDFARDILEDRDIVMRSSGSPRRTFCYVADAISGYYKALVHGRAGEAYNIGVEEPEISIVELAELMAALARASFGYRGRVVRRIDPEYLVDNPERRCPVIAKARAELGYHPTITLAEGLRRSLIWYADNRHGAAA